MGRIHTNRWSCVLDSFAYVSGIPAEELIEYIGHDGTEVGFHTQELIGPMLEHGMTVTEIQRNPVAIHPTTLRHRHITFKDSGNDYRFANYLNHGEGVLLGLNAKQAPHAVAWTDQRIYDPATGKSSTLLLKDSLGCLAGIDNDCRFAPTVFLLITRFHQ